MKGLSLNEYIDIMDFIAKYHQFADYRGTLYNTSIPYDKRVVNYPNYTFRNIKYVETSLDTRDSAIWKISFTCFTTISFHGGMFPDESEIPPYDSLYDWVIAYLRGETEICRKD